MTGCSLLRIGSPRAQLRVRMAIAFSLLAMAGCGGGPSYVLRTEFIGFSHEQKLDIESHARSAYRIQEGDILQVHFAYERDLNQDGVVVLPDGSVSLVGVDRIEVAGLTLAAADSLITGAYAREYREPDLSVLVQETPGRRVYVLGEVRNPGMYRVPSGGLDVMGVITSASGFTENAAVDAALVVRVTRDGYQVHEMDLKSFGGGRFAEVAAFRLEPYDIVYVPRTKIGDFAYFAKSVLMSIGFATRVVYDLKFVSDGTLGR